MNWGGGSDNLCIYFILLFFGGWGEGEGERLKKFIENEKCVWSLQSTVVTRNRGGGTVKKEGGDDDDDNRGRGLGGLFSEDYFFIFFPWPQKTPFRMISVENRRWQLFQM